MTDLISRADAIYELSRSSVYAWSIEQDQTAHNWALNIINALPSADAVHGEWVRHELWGNPWFTCSECNYHGRNDFNFCPNCGARMTPYKGGDDK